MRTQITMVANLICTCRNVTNPPKQITNNKGEIILSNNGVLDFGTFLLPLTSVKFSFHCSPPFGYGF
jgi:hypothetical protein